MMTKRAMLLAALAVALVAGVSAQDKPNFTGTWRVDPERSDQFSAGGAAQTITIEGSKMTITRTVAGNTQATVYMLDGTPEKKMAGPEGKQQETTRVTQWEGNAIVSTFKAPSQTRIDRRFIQEDGTMKIEISIEWLAGPRAGTTEKGWQVLNKVK